MIDRRTILKSALALPLVGVSTIDESAAVAPEPLGYHIYLLTVDRASRFNRHLRLIGSPAPRVDVWMNVLDATNLDVNPYRLIAPTWDPESDATVFLSSDHPRGEMTIAPVCIGPAWEAIPRQRILASGVTVYEHEEKR